MFRFISRHGAYVLFVSHGLDMTVSDFARIAPRVTYGGWA